MTAEVKTNVYVVKGAKESLLVPRVGIIKMQSKESRWGGRICSLRTIGYFPQDQFPHWSDKAHNGGILAG